MRKEGERPERADEGLQSRRDRDRAAARLDCAHPLSTIMLAAKLSQRRLLQTCLRSRPLQKRSYAVPPPQGKDEGELNIYNKLNDRFDPAELAVQDVSGVW